VRKGVIYEYHRTRWTIGNYSSELGYIKYQTEYYTSSYYKNEFEKSGLMIDEFYKQHIYIRKIII
jgi:hypothetical protein